MPFSHILGQDTAVGTLVRALEAGRVHHAYRFEGPPGVGKELAAVALSQALVCTGGDPLGCGRCDACRRAAARSDGRPAAPLHPDVQIVAKNFYPAAVIGRSRDELTEISVDQVRAIVLARAAYPPHEGRARVFIVRDAEDLSVGAANAFLKTLEEPRPGTHFILLTSRGDRLLNTIRSRTLPVRFAPLSEALIRRILRDRGVPEGRHDLAVELAAGSASTALDLADEEQTASRDAFVKGVLDAAAARDLGPAVAFAESVDRDKGALKDDLRALSAALAREARAAVASDPRHAGLSARRYAAVSRAVAQLERNASPSLAMASLIAELRSVVG
ncbi:ATP-binding protein [Sorangium sp. KYC3313]|uniref:DNA polymerase III subunit n=1 Tax=Sorangium sp. KYC3313 TaxID=3449740 RepID=UPI003F88F522